MKKISKSITINIPSIGMVLFEKSHKAKNIIISIKPPNIIRVAIPKRLSFKKAENFTKANTNWIHGKLNKISKSIKNKIELEAIDLKYAQKPLEERIKYLADKHGFFFKKLSIKNQRTRWGSCSQENNINLNARLLHLPQELMDYVIIHELVHTKIKNHSKRFWSKLDEHVGNSKYHKKELKKYFIKSI
jgi:predicted metal-dependent hydrolase